MPGVPGVRRVPGDRVGVACGLELISNFCGPWRSPLLRNFLGLRSEDVSHLTFFLHHPDLSQS